MKDRIRQLRIEQGLTQVQLGAVLGIGQKAISQMEIGINRPTLPQIEVLSRFFDVSADYLFFGVDAVRPEELEILAVLRDNQTLYASLLNIAKAQQTIKAAQTHQTINQ